MNVIGNLGGLLGNLIEQHGGAEAVLSRALNQMGGVQGGIGKLQQAGRGQQVQSWLGTGPNQPVSPDQLHQVFGDDQVNQWSQQTGMPKHDLLSQLSQYLPHAVDQMTPQGQVPTEEGGSAFDGAGINLGTRTI